LDQGTRDVVTLSKRLGHSTPQVTMTTYAHVIEEANDDAVRRALVNAMYADSKMARLMRGSESHRS
jgi:integrase